MKLSKSLCGKRRLLQKRTNHYTLNYKNLIKCHYVQERTGTNIITYKQEEQQEVPSICISSCFRLICLRQDMTNTKHENGY